MPASTGRPTNCLSGPVTARTTYWLGRPVEDRQADRVRLDDLEDPFDDRLVQPVGIERAVDGGRERRQAAEQLRPGREPLAFAGEGERGGEAIGDEGHRPDVALVEAVTRAVLDVHDPDELAVDQHRRAELGLDDPGRDPVVRVGGDVRHEGDGLRPHDPADDPARPVERRR